MKDMWTILVDKNAGGVIIIVSVAADMISPIANQNRFAHATSQPLREHASGKSSANDEIIDHGDYAASLARARLLASVS